MILLSKYERIHANKFIPFCRGVLRNYSQKFQLTNVADVVTVVAVTAAAAVMHIERVYQKVGRQSGSVKAK